MQRIKNQADRGFTLVEVTLVVSVLLGLISVTLFGASAYKEGTNRAMCIQHAANAQKAVRSFSNLYDFVPGNQVPGLRTKIYSEGGFLPIEPTCPSNGEYTFLDDQIPQLGTLYLTCSIPGHAPRENSIW